MKTKFITILSSFLLIFAFGFSVQAQSISGTVTDDNGVPLPGATVLVEGTSNGVSTDFDGKFIIPDLCNETYSIQVSHPYCLTKGFRVTVSGNMVETFKLEHHLDELNEITVNGKVLSNQSKTFQENIINKDELERYSSGSLGDALSSLSGVSSLNTGNTVIKPMINGLHSSRVVIINNGVRMEDQEWGAEHAPNVDINAINRLSLIKGAGALQYSGDAIGGVIIAEAAKAPFKDILFWKTHLCVSSNGRVMFSTS